MLRTTLKKGLLSAGLAVACLAGISTAAASSFPSQAVKMIVPYGAGTSTDAWARVVANGMADELGQSVVVDNRPGAGGNIGTGALARATPDGYTISFNAVGPLAINPALMSHLPYDPVNDFAPLALVGYTPMLLVVPPNSPWNTMADMLADLKKNPDEYFFASAGNGTMGHLAGELINTMTGAKAIHVPFKEGGQAVTAVMSGEVSYMFYHPTVAAPLVRDGKLKVLGVSSKARTPVMPEAAPLHEQGLPGFDVVGWVVLIAPRDVPEDAMQKLVAAGQKAVKDEKVRQALDKLGVQAYPDMTPAEVRQYMLDDMKNWAKLVEASGAKVD